MFWSIISRASRTFLLYMFTITAIVPGWILLNCLWHSLMCLVSPDDTQLSLMLSGRCSMKRVNRFLLWFTNISTISLTIQLTPLEDDSRMASSTSYTLVTLEDNSGMASSFGLFWHMVLCRFLLDVQVMSLLTFLKSFKILVQY